MENKIIQITTGLVHGNLVLFALREDGTILQKVISGTLLPTDKIDQWVGLNMV